jgi:hypothetical protein
MEIANLSSNGNGKVKTGTSISVTVITLMIGAALFARRRKRQRNLRDVNEERFNSFYLDNLAKDLGNLGRQESEEVNNDGFNDVEFVHDLGENEDDTESVLSSIEEGADAQFV